VISALGATLLVLGAIGGLAAGLLGFGGGVIMFPLLYYVPPLLGLEPLDAKTVAAVVVSQVFFSTIAGGTAHFRNHRLQWRLALVAGFSSATGSFFAGAISGRVSDYFLLVLFGCVTLIVGAIMLLPGPTPAQEIVSVDQVIVPLRLLAAISVLAGLIVGFLGAGNFVFVPLLIYILKVPTRIAIASSLFIAMINTFFGFMGKLVTGQIPLLLAVAVVVGSTLGALLGEKIHSHTPTHILRYLYAGTVGCIALRVWLTLLGLDP